MQINQRFEGPLGIVELEGHLIGDAATPLKQCMSKLATQEQSHLALELSAVSFIDSTGIGAIVASHKALKRERKHMYLVGASGQVAELIQFLRLDKIMSCFDDLDSLRAKL